MAPKNTSNSIDPEIAALGIVSDALKDLTQDAQQRVIDYVLSRLRLSDTRRIRHEDDSSDTDEVSEPVHEHKDSTTRTDTAVEADPDFDGVSPVAVRWTKRNGLTAAQLSGLYSLGVDEIDLVAQSVPGDSKRERMHNLLLLKGVAAYLSTGAARFTHEQAKETCLHYDAYDQPNFARYISQFAPEVAGAKGSGYTLTARGLANATSLIKSMVQKK